MRLSMHIYMLLFEAIENSLMPDDAGIYYRIHGESAAYRAFASWILRSISHDDYFPRAFVIATGNKFSWYMQRVFRKLGDISTFIILAVYEFHIYILQRDMPRAGLLCRRWQASPALLRNTTALGQLSDCRRHYFATRQAYLTKPMPPHLWGHATRMTQLPRLYDIDRCAIILTAARLWRNRRRHITCCALPNFTPAISSKLPSATRISYRRDTARRFHISYRDASFEHYFCWSVWRI